MEIALWIIQGILAAMFAMAGIMKSTQPIEKLAPKLPWVKEYSAGMVRFIGIAELLGAIGLIVPWLTGILPILTPIAAVGLAIIMVLASLYHIKKNEYKAVIFNGILLALSVVVAYYRFKQI